MTHPTASAHDRTRDSAKRTLALTARVVTVAAILAACAWGSAARAGEATPTDLEKQMFEMVNADRKENGRGPYVYDETLAAVARSHSEDMMKNGFFDHKSPTTGLVADRLFAAKVRAMSCGENIAMSPTLGQAETGLMNSLGHRANILHNEYTRVGIGIVRASNGVLYVTQVFANPAPATDLKTAGAELLGKLNEARVAAKKAAFAENAALSGQAAALAAQAARDGAAGAVDPAAVARAAGMAGKRLGVAMIATWTPNDLAGAEALLAPAKGQIGFGFAENTEHKELGYGIVWVVVIFAE